jgi:integrase
MPKISALEPTFDKTKNRWRLAVPASFSDTGRRRNLYYKTKASALLESERLQSIKKISGSSARILRASDSEDADKALKVLREAGSTATLHQLALDHVKASNVRERSITLRDLWQRHTEAKSGRSDAYQRTFAIVESKVIAKLGKRLVCDLTKDELEAAIRSGCQAASTFNLVLRTFSPALNRAVREGWATENVCKRIERQSTRRRSVAVLSLPECRKLMASAIDYRDDETLPEWLQVDASGALPALALMLFAGVRPAEVGRLEWDDIDMDAGTVFVSNVKSKTDRSRFFEMPDTLRSWLDMVPEDERHGAIVPPNWKKVWQAIRTKVDIKDERDQCRKSFASYHLAAFGDVNLTRSIMGHEVGDILHQHYRGLVRPKEAKAFWRIVPTVNEVKAVAS